MDFQTNLSDHEQKEFKAAFAILDKSGDGTITISELRDFLKSLGEVDPTEDEIKELIETVDIEQKGAINFPQFLKLMEINALDSNKEVKSAFELFKTENNAISVDEMHKVLAQLGETLTRQELKDLINEIEQNKSGVLSFEGLSKLMQTDFKL